MKMAGEGCRMWRSMIEEEAEMNIWGVVKVLKLDV
jgi:hypothetical protein